MIKGLFCGVNNKKMTITLPIKFLDWIKMLFGSKTDNSYSDTNFSSSSQEIEFESIQNIAKYISHSLTYLADKDVIASCRIHREFGKLKRPIIKSRNENGEIYLSYLWEGAEKVIETARHTSTNPNHIIKSDLKSEITVLSHSIANLESVCRDRQTDRLKEQIDKERDFIQFTIAVRSKDMKHEQFNDGILEYSYLVLLYHLYSFLNAASKLTIFRYNQSTPYNEK